MHPSQLSDLLLEHFPAVAPLAPSLIHGYSDLMLKLAAQSGKRHRSAGTDGIPNDAMTIYCRRLQRKFGVDGFRVINEIVGCINHTRNWSVDTNETKAYWLTDKGKRMIEMTRQQAIQGHQNLLLDHTGNQIRKRGNGIFTARDGKGRNAVTDANIEWAVPVNLDAISMVLEVGTELFFPDVDAGRLARTDSALRAIHSCALNENVGRGLIPQTYRESPSGRLYGTGELSLQTVTREARRVALHAAHECDFENCHYRLLANVALQSDIGTPVINEYLNDPRAYRTNLAAELESTYDQAKKVLLATLFGATQSLWTECAIPMLIGPEKALWLYESPQFIELTFEIMAVGEYMRQHAQRLQNGAIINCRGKACSGNARQELAHLLQGMESELLHVVMQEYRDDILIIQHDGFTMSRYVDLEEIEALLSYATGIYMPVTHVELTLPGIS